MTNDRLTIHRMKDGGFLLTDAREYSGPPNIEFACSTPEQAIDFLEQHFFKVKLCVRHVHAEPEQFQSQIVHTWPEE